MSQTALFRCFVLALVLALTSCEITSADSCRVICTADAECPAGQTCGALGLCTNGEACACNAGEFLGCAGATARSCSRTGNAVEVQDCGPPGCNAEAQRCNYCKPNSEFCNTFEAVEFLTRCDANGIGIFDDSETCRLGCADDFDSTPAHCRYLEPLFLPNICTEPASGDLVFDSDMTLDTSTNLTCNGGIVAQQAGNAPEVCVVRAKFIRVAYNQTLTVRGSRALALVADDLVDVTGVLDISADGTIGGPGAAGIGNGSFASTGKGGGGAGFHFRGGDGGSAGQSSGGGEGGGSIVNPVTDMFAATPALIGGWSPVSLTGNPAGGGGGGAVTLIACRGDVSVGGVIHAGGGGGSGGKDTFGGTGTTFIGGAGGGAGGMILLQGIEVRIPVSGELYANGGGGGGGCSTDGCSGLPGNDGNRALAEAPGGDPTGAGGRGGNGAIGSDGRPGLQSSTSPGGGGGSPGWLFSATPTTGSRVVAGNQSPTFSPNITLTTH
jgi:hypothetical protein